MKMIALCSLGKERLINAHLRLETFIALGGCEFRFSLSERSAECIFLDKCERDSYFTQKDDLRRIRCLVQFASEERDARLNVPLYGRHVVVQVARTQNIDRFNGEAVGAFQGEIERLTGRELLRYEV